MLTAGNTTFTYDDNGNMLTKTTNAQTTTQTWDVLGQLVKIANPDGSSVKFVYDGVGHRVKRWRSNGNETVYFVNDKSGKLVQLLAEVDASNSTVAEYTLGNTLLTMDRGGITYSYHYDALGSTRIVTDSTQTPTLTYTYDAYGNVLSSTGTLTNPYQFVAAYGYYSDPDTGLLYLRARYYSPTIGRFISMDSYLGKDNDPASLHRYLYCENGPLTNLDPSRQMRLSSLAWYELGIAFALGAIGTAQSAKGLQNTGIEKLITRATAYTAQSISLSSLATFVFSESLIGLDLPFAEDLQNLLMATATATTVGCVLVATRSLTTQLSFANTAINGLAFESMMVLGALVAADFAFAYGK